jgi:hypothetical protein
MANALIQFDSMAAQKEVCNAKEKNKAAHPSKTSGGVTAKNGYFLDSAWARDALN